MCGLSLNKMTTLDRKVLHNSEDLFTKLLHIPPPPNWTFWTDIGRWTKQYTTFSTNRGYFHWNFFMFWLSGVPFIFTRLITNLLMEGKTIFYLDEILFHSTLEKHTKSFQIMLERIRQFWLIASPKKIHIAVTGVIYF